MESLRCGTARSSWSEAGSRTKHAVVTAIAFPGRMRIRLRYCERMLNVALTGNIASGKSTVVELFRKWGATVIDADVLAREAQAPGGAVLAAIARRFGADVLAQGGSLDRAALRAKVMGD